MWEANMIMKSGDTASAVGHEAEESARALCDVWSRVVSERGTGEVLDRNGLAIRWADSQFVFWNCLTFVEQIGSSERLKSLFWDAAAYLRSHERPGLLWVMEGLVDPTHRPSIAHIADEAGLRLILSGFGMAGDVLSIAEPQCPELEFVRVTSEEHLEIYADLNALAYSMPLETVRDALRGSALWKSDAHAYLAYSGGEPVSVAATIANGDHLFLILVATAPAYQRKGYGEAVVRKALFEGAKATGLTRTVLHATLAGAPVYERIGYHKVSDLGFYGLK